MWNKKNPQPKKGVTSAAQKEATKDLRKLLQPGGINRDKNALHSGRIGAATEIAADELSQFRYSKRRQSENEQFFQVRESIYGCRAKDVRVLGRKSAVRGQCGGSAANPNPNPKGKDAIWKLR